MVLNVTPVTNHRKREEGVLAYPVYSRRSGGLSIGINLFTDKKCCPFDCPYCEVFPFTNDASEGLFGEDSPDHLQVVRRRRKEEEKGLLESELRTAIKNAQEQNIPIKDICFSGNGEPTLSPAFGDALKLADRVRAETAPSAELVVITNGAGLLQPQIFSLLAEMTASPSFNIWLKLDAGTPDWYQKINRTSIPFEKLIAKIKEFASCAPFTIQTMLCAINGEKPPHDEERAWLSLVCKLAEIAANGKGGIRKVQIYGKARPAPEDPLASALSESYLEMRAASLRQAFAKKDIVTSVEIYL